MSVLGGAESGNIHPSESSENMKLLFLIEAITKDIICLELKKVYVTVERQKIDHGPPTTCRFLH